MKELKLIDDLRHAHVSPGRRKTIRSKPEWVRVESDIKPTMGREQEECTIEAGYGTTFYAESTAGWEYRRQEAHRIAVRSVARGLFGDLWGEIGNLQRLIHEAGIEDWEIRDEIMNRLNGIFEATGGRL